MNKVLLSVGTTDFDGRQAPLPSYVMPKIEKIKNIQRSIGGTLHIDIAAAKRHLEIMFELLSQEQFDDIRNIFDSDNAEGLSIKYFDRRGLADDARFYVDDITYEPWIIGDIIKWKNVVVNLLEI